MDVVVSDTSPIRGLGFLGRLDLLSELFDSVIVPPAVAHELRNPGDPALMLDVRTLPGVTIQAPGNKERVKQLMQFFGAGESEALILADELGIIDILMDDKQARIRAYSMNLKPTGLLGVLLLAKRVGKVDAVRPLVDNLQAGLNFYVSDTLRQTVFEMAGE